MVIMFICVSDIVGTAFHISEYDSQCAVVHAAIRPRYVWSAMYGHVITEALRTSVLSRTLKAALGQSSGNSRTDTSVH